MKNAVGDETSVSNDTLYGSSHHAQINARYRIDAFTNFTCKHFDKMQMILKAITENSSHVSWCTALYGNSCLTRDGMYLDWKQLQNVYNNHRCPLLCYGKCQQLNSIDKLYKKPDRI